jgi:DNA-binding MarR family transcriptional regulator
VSEVPWLDADQQRDWRAFIDGSLRLMDALERPLKAGHGLTMADYEILVRLSEAPDHRMRMAELADSASQSRSRLSHTVARLEARSLVSREDCPSDKRGVLAQLTEQGFDSLKQAAPDHVAAVREYLVDLVSPEDLQAIGRAFRAVAERIDDPT